MSKDKDNKRNLAEKAILQVQKKYGKESLNFLGNTEPQIIDSYSTGSLSVDKILGIGGVAKGRIIEVYGPEASGKTTLTLQIIAQAQKKGDYCAFIDAEHALDINYAAALGCDIDNLIVTQPDYGEQGLEIVETLVYSGGVDLIVVDSVAALTPKTEIEGDMDDVQVGAQARMMSKALRKFTSQAQKAGCTIIFINQLRDKIGMMGPGESKTTPGGNALKFYASQRVEVKRIGSIKAGDNVVGNKTRVTIKKNKVAPPFQTADVEIKFGEGISPYSEIMDLGVKYDIIDKAGAWFSYNNAKLGQGKEKSIDNLKENPDLFNEIRNKILPHIAPNLVEDKTKSE